MAPQCGCANRVEEDVIKKENCSNCRYWDHADIDNDFADCRLGPPVVIAVLSDVQPGVSGVQQHRPDMYEGDWCGKWKPRQERDP